MNTSGTVPSSGSCVINSISVQPCTNRLPCGLCSITNSLCHFLLQAVEITCDTNNAECPK